jgi:hypothetical protein
MNEIDQATAITKNIVPEYIQEMDKFSSMMKYQYAMINKISPDIFNSYNEAMKATLPIIDTMKINSSLIDAMKATMPSADTIRSMMPVIDALKVVMPSMDAIKSTIPVVDSIKAALPLIDTMKVNSSLIDALKATMPSMDVIKSIMPTLNFVNNDAFKSIDYIVNNHIVPSLSNISYDVFDNFNFETIDHINAFINRTIDEISEKSEYDDNDIEKITELSNFTLGMTITNNCPNSIKKNILRNFLRNIWKLVGIPQFAVILTIVFFIITNILEKYESPKVIINQTIKEIIIIENEYHELNLRGITNNTKLYNKPYTKSIIIYNLDCGDIIEVLKQNKKWVYIRLYKTDIEGWVFKKYTKGTRNKKTKYVLPRKYGVTL